MKINLKGIVIHGDGLGTTLGYPTANLRMPKNKKLDFGIYAANVRIENKQYMGVAVIGIPSEIDKKPKLEIHILDFNKDIYGKWMSATLRKRFHGLVNYPTKKKLLNAIEDDCQNARKFLNML